MLKKGVLKLLINIFPIFAADFENEFLFLL